MVDKKQLKFIAFPDLLKITGVGFIIALHWVAFYGSIKYANVSVALVCFSATGFFTALFEPFLLKKKIKLAELLLGIMAITGIYIIFDFHPQYKTGIIFGIIAAIGSALFPIFNKQLLNRFTPRMLTFYELGGGFIILSLMLPLYLKGFPAENFFPSFSDWIWLIILAGLCTVISFDLQLRALQKISAFTINLSYNLEPVYGILLAFLLFHENKNLHPGFYFGLALIILSIFLQMIRVRKEVKNNAK